MLDSETMRLPLSELKAQPDATAVGRGSGGFDPIRRANPIEEENWESMLPAKPSATFFHGAAWARVLVSSYGFNPVYFATGDQAKLTSLLPIMEVRSWLTGRRGVSLPFTDECAPLCADPESFRRLFQEALGYGKSRGWKYLECRGGRELFGEAPSSCSFFGHRVDLREKESALLAKMESSTRRALRKAEQQAGLTIEFSTQLEAVREFHSLLHLTRKRHGVPPQPFSFFAAIQRHVLAEGRGCVALARSGGVPVAGGVYFRFGRTGIYKFGASDERFQQLRANNLVMWRAIQWHAQQGCESFEFGRTAPSNEGLRRFKLGWGATEYPIDYVRYDIRKRAFTTARDAAEGWQTEVFRRMPDPVFRLIGSALYKHAA
jgi:hypothetical protein